MFHVVDVLEMVNERTWIASKGSLCLCLCFCACASKRSSTSHVVQGVATGLPTRFFVQTALYIAVSTCPHYTNFLSAINCIRFKIYLLLWLRSICCNGGIIYLCPSSLLSRDIASQQQWTDFEEIYGR